MNDSYPINVPAGVQLVGVEEVNRDEVVAAALRASTAELLQAHARNRPGFEDVLEQSLRSQIGDGEKLSSVALRDGRIIGLSIFGPVGPNEAARMNTPVAPLARGRLLWLDPKERGLGMDSTMLRHSHGRIAAATIPWALCRYPASMPASGYFWNREGYRPLTVQWQRTPAAWPR